MTLLRYVCNQDGNQSSDQKMQLLDFIDKCRYLRAQKEEKVPRYGILIVKDLLNTEIPFIPNL